MKFSFLTASALSIAAACANAQEQPNPMRNAYFGETHMHTALSLDAYIGGTRLMPSDSLRFAKGEPVTNNPRRGVVLTAIIAFITVALGDLNVIAPVVAMFFLVLSDSLMSRRRLT